MDHIVESVPFANCDEEPRIRSIIQSLVDKDEVPEYKSFTEESEKKKLRRKRRVSNKLQTLAIFTIDTVMLKTFHMEIPLRFHTVIRYMEKFQRKKITIRNKFK